MLSTFAELDSGPLFAGQRVPKEELLRTRVDQFYKAYVDQNWPLIVRLMTPDVQRCHDPEEIRKGWSEDGLVKVLSWDIQEITKDPAYTNLQRTIDCTGGSYRVKAGAKVRISQLDQKGEDKPERGIIVHIWVFVDGQWLIDGPED